MSGIIPLTPGAAGTCATDGGPFRTGDCCFQNTRQAPGFAISASWVPSSATRPFFSRKIWSATCTVDRRWALRV
ncbi:MAG: hypothetical protein R3224_00900 [Balneolaceae bacterium]|nr:hypothetical protein [Balneolaceae bacterium]